MVKIQLTSPMVKVSAASFIQPVAENELAVWAEAAPMVHDPEVARDDPPTQS